MNTVILKIKLPNIKFVWLKKDRKGIWKTNCLQCGLETIVREDYLCRKHHTERKKAEWLDNTDPNNLGIVKWIHDLMPEFAYNETPWFHKELFLNLLKLYNPEYRNKFERLYEFISFRGSAKSTAANTLFVSYLIANNGEEFKIMIDDEVRTFKIEEKLIVIISETAGSVEDFTTRIRDEFTVNPRIKHYYNFVIEQAWDDETGSWTKMAFKMNKCWVLGAGSGQQIRGKVKGASRPTLVIADDIYSENNTITEESRKKIKNWWNRAVENSVDDIKGKILMLGTIVHDDTVLVQAENNDMWMTQKITPMPKELFEEFIKEHIEVNWDTNLCQLPFDKIEDKNERLKKQRGYYDKVQNSRDWQLEWPGRIDLYYIAKKYKKAVYDQDVSGFYQEYFHITQSPEERRFKKEFFRTINCYEIEHRLGMTWLRIKKHEEDDWSDWQNVNIEFGVDLSGGIYDDAVITVVASNSNGQIFVLYQASGKWSMRDDLRDDVDHVRYYKVCIDRSAIKRVGVIDEMFRLCLKFKPKKIKIGCAAEEGQTIREARKVFKYNKDYITRIIERPQNVKEGKKETRIANTLLPFYETRSVFHVGNMSKLEYQLEFLGKTKHDDHSDALECAVWLLEFPYNIDSNIFEDSKKEDITQDENYAPHLHTSEIMSQVETIWADWRVL